MTNFQVGAEISFIIDEAFFSKLIINMNITGKIMECLCFTDVLSGWLKSILVLQGCSFNI